MKCFVVLLAILELSASASVFGLEGKSEDQAMSASHKKAVELLQKVDVAAKAVNTARYHSVFFRRGPGADQLGKLEGDVWLGPVTDEGVRKFRVVMKRIRPGSAEVEQLTVGCDGDNYYLIDPAEKTVYADLDPVILGRKGRFAQALIVREFSHPTPFSDEINSDHPEILGSQKIGDVDCDHVAVKYTQGAKAQWWFGKKDHLPRQRMDLLRGGDDSDGDGEKPAQIRTITKLEVGAKFGAKDFDFKVPAGFKKTDEPVMLRVPVQ